MDRDSTGYGTDPSEQRSIKNEVYPHVEESSPRPTRSQKLKDDWTWEISSLALSLMTLIAITIVLRILDGKPLSWWKSSISPNSLVSIFAAVSKSAMLLSVTECISQAKWLHFSQDRRRLYNLQLFDNASRGPLGSLIFLWRSMFNFKDVIASVATIVMIAALAVDPFMQQIIDYHLRPVPTPETNGATTYSTQMYDSGILMNAAEAKCTS